MNFSEGIIRYQIELSIGMQILYCWRWITTRSIFTRWSKTAKRSEIVVTVYQISDRVRLEEEKFLKKYEIKKFIHISSLPWKWLLLAPNPAAWRRRSALFCRCIFRLIRQAHALQFISSKRYRNTSRRWLWWTSAKCIWSDMTSISVGRKCRKNCN